MRVVVTGGAGFLGSHLCERLIASGHQVLCLDSLLTGSESNLEGLMKDKNFSFSEMDVTKPIAVEGAVDLIAHFASPASPIDYLEQPIHTLKVGALGTLHGLGLAKAKGATFLLASTSEVYGDPKVSPQPEEYWGNVNPIGPRGVYDEAKRFGEALVYAYQRTHSISVRVARIFNVYGPRMRRDDGRAVPTFIRQALAGEPLTVHGDGTQTRSLAYVDDAIDGFVRLTESDVAEPVNIGNPHEVTVLYLAELTRELCGSKSEVVFTERPVDDPEIRCPDITRARERLGWSPQVSLEEGLERTIDWCRKNWM